MEILFALRVGFFGLGRDASRPFLFLSCLDVSEIKLKSECGSRAKKLRICGKTESSVLQKWLGANNTDVPMHRVPFCLLV